MDEAERGFQTHMRRLIAHLRVTRGTPRSEDRNHQVIIDTVLGRNDLPLPDTQGLDYSIIDHESAIKYSYCFWAYSVLQAVCLEFEGEDTCETNDLEDGQLCAYVPLDEETWVVAGDERLRTRLTETRDLLEAVGLGARAQFHPATPDILVSGGPS